MAPAHEQTSLLTRKPPTERSVFWFYASAAIAFGIKDNAFSYLLLMYCDHVLGLPGYLAGRVMAIALAWDAVWDLFIGHLSDKTSSGLGRRHPYMYASLLVLPPCFAALFDPIVKLDHQNSFAYVLLFTIMVRTGTTLFEIPSAAQLPDFEQNYANRSTWMAMRYTFGWFGGALLHVVNFTFWVGAYGNSSPTGYAFFGRAGAFVIFLAILISSLGTQGFASALPKPKNSWSLWDIKHEISDVQRSLRNKNFQALFFSAIASAVSQGLSNALNIYFQSYFFGISGKEVAIVSAWLLLAPVCANYLVPLAVALWGKKSAALMSMATTLVLHPLPSVLVLLDWWPPLGSSQSLCAYTVHAIVMVLLSIITAVMCDAMTADVVEDGEVSTERRSEGLYFATRGFAAKIVSGLGIVLAGNIVTVVGLDQVRSPADMSFQKRFDMVTFVSPLVSVLQITAMLLLSRYGIGRAEHEANLATLAQRSKREA